MSQVCVVGTGYVGLTTAVGLAHLGHTVIGADINDEKIATLQAGGVPFVEEGMVDLLAEGLRRKRLSFTTDVATAVSKAEFVLLCLPTPQGADGNADLSAVRAAVKSMARHLAADSVVITKSTVPVGSAFEITTLIDRGDVMVVSNPEFLREGTAIHDFMHPDRIVIGAQDQAAAARAVSLYLKLAAPIVVTDPVSAEIIKYVANSFLATKISYANAVARLCEETSADVRDVLLGVGYDTRIGHEFLKPGPGWGGSCFPKDTQALLSLARQYGFEFEPLVGAVAVNDQQKARVVDKIMKLTDKKNPVVGIWGLTFKARTDDIRDSPSIAIAEALIERGAKVVGYDPTVENEIGQITVSSDPYAALDGADVLAVLTEWEEFRWLDAEKAAEAMRGRGVVDARNILSRSNWEHAGFEYVGIGT